MILQRFEDLYRKNTYVYLVQDESGVEFYTKNLYLSKFNSDPELDWEKQQKQTNYDNM